MGTGPHQFLGAILRPGGQLPREETGVCVCVCVCVEENDLLSLTHSLTLSLSLSPGVGGRYQEHSEAAV